MRYNSKLGIEGIKLARKSRKHLQNQQQNTQKAKPTPPTYIAGIYARVSSDENSDGSIENQINISEAFINERPNIKLHKVYMDSGISAFAVMRPSFEDMLYDIQNNIINCVIVKDVSRFSRDYLEAGDLLQKKFPTWGTRFISINDGFDSLYADATGLQMALRTLIAYEYSKDLSKKISSAISVRQNSGIYTPPRLPYGYKKVKTSQGIQWQLDEPKSKEVRKIFNAALEGNSAYSIASFLNTRSVPAPKSEYWTPGSVLRILRNETYTGTFITGKTRSKLTDRPKTISVSSDKWIRHRHHHPPIIDEIMFYTIQRELEIHTSPEKKKSEEVDFFCGKLYCGICGRKMKRKRAVNGSVYYICPRKDESNTCPNKARNAEKLKKQVYQHIRQKIDEAQVYRTEMLTFEQTPYFLNRQKEQHHQLEVLRSELERQIDLFRTVNEKSIEYGCDNTPDTQELFQYLASVRNNLREKISEIECAMDEYWCNESSKAVWIQPLFEFKDCPCLTREMVENVIEKIKIYMDTVGIIFIKIYPNYKV